MSMTALSAFRQFSKPSAFQIKVLVAAFVTAFSDWLFFGHLPGISVAIFLLVLAIGIALCHAPDKSLSSNIRASILLLLALLPIIEELNPLSLAIGVAGTAVYSLLMTGTFSSIMEISLQPLLRLLVRGPFRLPYDWKRTRRKSTEFDPSRLQFDFRSWLVPAGFGAVFILLFVSANPVIEQFVNWLISLTLDWDALIDLAWRAGFWAMFLAISWAFLQPYRKHLPNPFARITGGSGKAEEKEPSRYFGVNTIFRSLVLFNVIFATHTISDGIYLWGGAELPTGLTYAQYAYRGTYALMAAALVAAIFVLAAMRPEGDGIRFPLVRRLVYLWIGQSVVMIISALYRLDLYTSIYALTYTRVAGFIWVGLVGVGLMLIVVQIMRRASNSWLVRANIMALVAVAYSCSLTNFDHIIAKYNIQHSREISGKGQFLDWQYLRRLGDNTLPAILGNYHELKAENPSFGRTWHSLDWVEYHVRDIQLESDNWRQWGYRQWRLSNYLRNYRKVQQEDTAP